MERFDIDLRDKDIGVAPSTAVNTLVERVSSYLPEPASDIVGQAYLYADHCHRGQKRKSGEPYIAHPLQTALFLADLHLDDQTIIAALLHDVVEDCGVSLAEIDERFGPEVTKLVDGVTKLTRMDTRLHDPEDGVLESLDDPDSLYAESLRKMLVSMAEDIRVVLIKLADRLHNMQTLDALPPEKAPAHLPRNVGHLLPVGPPPGHLGNQMALGRPCIPAPARNQVPGNFQNAGRQAP